MTRQTACGLRRSGRRTDCPLTKNITTGITTNKRLTMHDVQCRITSRAINDAGLPTDPQPLAGPSSTCMSMERAPTCQPDAYGHSKNHGKPLIPPDIAGPMTPQGHGPKFITAPDLARGVIVFFKKPLHVGSGGKRFGVCCDPMRDAGKGDPDTAFGWSVGKQDRELLTLHWVRRDQGWKGGGWLQ